MDDLHLKTSSTTSHMLDLLKVQQDLLELYKEYHMITNSRIARLEEDVRALWDMLQDW